jgi:CHAT domain-containing protein
MCCPSVLHEGVVVSAAGEISDARFALDSVELTYAPNARVATAARRRAQLREAERLFAVENPQPVAAAALPSARDEVANAIAFFDAPVSIGGEQATRARVLDGVGGSDVLQFACHGTMNPDDPLASALIMAHDEPLTVRDLVDRELSGVRLAVLSACETALIGPDLPDEVVALPAGLLQAGVAGIVAPLWAVPDVSTMVLMTRFYELWRRGGLAPPDALRTAQQWARDTTRDELHTSFPDVSALSGERVPAAAREMWASTRPFAAPRYWASFCYVGA